MANGPSLQGIDFSQYAQWPQVNIDGLVYYQVPGNPGVVYDPRLGKWFYDQREAAQRKQEEAIKASTPSMSQQLIPVVGGTAGTVLGAAAITKAPKWFGSAKGVGNDVAKGVLADSNPAVAPSVGQGGGILANGTPNFSASTGVVTDNPLDYSAMKGAQTGNAVELPPNATQGPNGEVLTADGKAIDPSTGEVVGRVAQGALGAYLIYSGVKNFKEDRPGGVLSAGYGAALTGSALGSETAAAAMPYAGLAYGGYNMGKMLLDDNAKYKGSTGSNAARGAGAGAAMGASVGSLFPGVGTLVGLGLGAAGGAAIGAIEGLTGSGKGGGQVIRDKWRKGMQEAGFMDQNFQGTAADGSVIDWNHVNGDQGSGVKNMHFEDPTVGAAVAYGDMLATALGATGTARENIAGELAKGALYNANGDRAVVEQNMRHFAGLLGLDYNTINANIDAVAEKSKSEKDQTTFATNKAAAGLLFGQSGPPAPAPTQGVVPTQKASGGVLQITGTPADAVRKAMAGVNARRR